MTTSKPTGEQLDLLTSLPSAFPAKTSVPPGQAKASTVSVVAYSSRQPELLARYCQNGRCWRTSQLSLLGGLTEFSEGWPRSGMTVNGIAYQLQPLALRTYATGSGSLPTPSAVQYGTNQGGSAGRTGKIRPSLHTMARTGRWPTPTVGDSKSSGSRNTENSKANPGISLTDAVRGNQGTGRKFWPTPAAHEGRLGYQDRTSGKKGKQISLTTSVMNSEGRKPQQEWDGGQLNPNWVEWLMGYPTGWTDLNASETPSSRK